MYSVNVLYRGVEHAPACPIFTKYYIYLCPDWHSNYYEKINEVTLEAILALCRKHISYKQNADGLPHIIRKYYI